MASLSLLVLLSTIGSKVPNCPLAHGFTFGWSIRHPPWAVGALGTGTAHFPFHVPVLGSGLMWVMGRARSYRRAPTGCLLGPASSPSPVTAITQGTLSLGRGGQVTQADQELTFLGMKHVARELPVTQHFHSVEVTSQEANLQESLGESTAERHAEHQNKGRRRTKVSDTAVTWLAGLIHEGPLT